jgi:hypothetical protein
MLLAIVSVVLVLHAQLTVSSQLHHWQRKSSLRESKSDTSFPQLCWTRPQIRDFNNGWYTSFYQSPTDPLLYNETNVFKPRPSLGSNWATLELGLPNYNTWSTNQISDSVHAIKRYSSRWLWQSDKSPNRGIVQQGHTEWYTQDSAGDDVISAYGAYISYVRANLTDANFVIETYSETRYFEYFNGTTRVTSSTTDYSWSKISCLQKKHS